MRMLVRTFFGTVSLRSKSNSSTVGDTLEDGREDAEEIIEQLLACVTHSNAKGDRFNAEFFHTLVELLSVRYNITLFEDEMIDREVFEDEWPRICDELGI